MESRWLQNKSKTQPSSPALRTMMLPKLGSTLNDAHLSLIAKQASLFLRCKEANAKTQFVRKLIEGDILGQKYHQLCEGGVSEEKLNVMVADGVYHLGQKCSIDNEFLSDNAYQTISWRLSRDHLQKNQIALLIKHCLELGFLSPNAAMEGLINHSSNRSEITHYIANCFNESMELHLDNEPSFGISFLDTSSATSADTDEGEGVCIQFGFDDGIEPIMVAYPSGDDAFSFLKREVIDSLCEATQMLVLDFASPGDIIHGRLIFDESDFYRESLKNNSPSSNEVFGLAKSILESGEDTGELIMLHECVNEFDIETEGFTEEVTQIVGSYADEIALQLHLRQQTQERVVANKYSVGTLEGRLELVNFLENRVVLAEKSWCKSPQEQRSLEVLLEWAQWLKCHVEEGGQQLSSHYLHSQDDYERGLALENFIVAGPTGLINTTYSIFENNDQHAMEVGADCSVQLDDTKQTLESAHKYIIAFKKVYHYLSSI